MGRSEKSRKLRRNPERRRAFRCTPRMEILEARRLLAQDLACEPIIPVGIDVSQGLRSQAIRANDSVDPMIDRRDPIVGQVIYLDFDGASDFTYHGPVSVFGIEIPPLKAPPPMTGSECEIASTIIARLNSQFTDLGVTFTSVQPTSSMGYSTVYIGGDDSAFRDYGSFLGLAENVDVGNQNHSDIGIVFTEQLAERSNGSLEFIHQTEVVIAHEVLHLLGFSHAHATEGRSPMAAVAYADGGTTQVSANPVHSWLTLQGYEFFESQFGETTLTPYHGEATVYPEGNNDRFTEGAYDEDQSLKNAFGDGTTLLPDLLDPDHPSLRHFWNVDTTTFERQFDDGLLGYDSAPNRAIKYISGGIGLTRQADSNWPLAKDGAVAAYQKGNLGDAFYLLGHAAHLLEDMTVPVHALNDAHLTYVGDDPFHDWVDGKSFPGFLDSNNEERYKTWSFVELLDSTGGVGGLAPAYFDRAGIRSAAELRANLDVATATGVHPELARLETLVSSLGHISNVTFPRQHPEIGKSVPAAGPVFGVHFSNCHQPSDRY